MTIYTTTYVCEECEQTVPPPCTYCEETTTPEPVPTPCITSTLNSFTSDGNLYVDVTTICNGAVETTPNQIVYPSRGDRIAFDSFGTGSTALMVSTSLAFLIGVLAVAL